MIPEREYGEGEFILGKHQNDINVFKDIGKIETGSRIYGYVDDTAYYEIGLPNSPVVAVMNEMYGQTAGVYTETFDGRFKRWQIVSYKYEGFRLHCRHFEEGGVTLISDDCRAILYAERVAGGNNKYYLWTYDLGVIDRSFIAQKTNDINLTSAYLKFFDEREEDFIRAIKNEKEES